MKKSLMENFIFCVVHKLRRISGGLEVQRNVSKHSKEVSTLKNDALNVKYTTNDTIKCTTTWNSWSKGIGNNIKRIYEDGINTKKVLSIEQKRDTNPSDAVCWVWIFIKRRRMFRSSNHRKIHYFEF